MACPHSRPSRSSRGVARSVCSISRVMRGKIQLRTEAIELATVIGQAVEIASPLLEQRKHQLVITMPRTGLLVDADRVRLAQVFANLLANAAKYTEPGGRIEVTG